MFAKSDTEFCKCGISYSREELLSLNPGRVPLPRDVYDTLLDLNITSIRPTRRGCRAGRDKQRPIPIMVNQRHTEITFDKQNGHMGQICLENLTAIPPHNKSKLRFCALNVQSVRNKTSEICDLVMDNNLDVVAISKTWLKPSCDEMAISEPTPTGFHVKISQDKMANLVGVLEYYTDLLYL